MGRGRSARVRCRGAGSLGLAIGLWLVAGASFAAGLYECRDGAGRLAYQDRPCDAGLQARELRTAPPAAPEPEPELPIAAAAGPPPPPAGVPEGQRHVIVSVRADDPAWRAALAHARMRRSVAGGASGVSLLRVFLEQARIGDDIQAAGGKLDGPADGGGGRHREIPSGGFLLVEHLSSASDPGHDEVALAALAHGVTRLEIPAAAPGQVVAFGNVVLARASAERLGRLEIHVSGGLPGTRVVIGPLVVGGTYGRSLRCDAHGLCDPGWLAAGPYELLVPGFDPRRSRFTTSVAAGRVTRMQLSIRAGGEVVLAGEETIRP